MLCAVAKQHQKTVRRVEGVPSTLYGVDGDIATHSPASPDAAVTIYSRQVLARRPPSAPARDAPESAVALYVKSLVPAA